MILYGCENFINAIGICGDKSLMFFNLISILMTILPLSIVNWSNFRTVSFITFIFLLFFSIACLFINILIFIWRKKGLLKDRHKDLSITLINIVTAIVLILLIDCISVEFLCSIDILTVNYPCKQNNQNKILNIDCSKIAYPNKYNMKIIKDYEHDIIYLALTLIEIVNVLSLFNWHMIQNEIIRGIHIPNKSITSIRIPPIKYDSQGNKFINHTDILNAQQQGETYQPTASSSRQKMDNDSNRENQNIPQIEKENQNKQLISNEEKVTATTDENLNKDQVNA